MLYLMKIEWKKVRLPVLTVILLLSAAACIMTCTMDNNYIIWFRLDAWEIGTEYFSLLFPLFTVMPLSWNLYYERKDNFMCYVLPRVSQKKYLTAKWIVHALSAFFILFIPYMLSAICALYVNNPILYVNDAFQHIFMEAYTNTPLLYAVVLSCWKGLLGILIMTFGFVLSMYVKNLFVIMTGPFVYTMLVDFVLAILQLEQYRLVVSFEPTVISSTAYNIGSLIIGPTMLCIIILGVAIYLSKIRKTAIVDV